MQAPMKPRLDQIGVAARVDGVAVDLLTPSP
jgi:hypothetical protein